ncbi:MAG: endonuclease domain-containing protein [Alphaproteobacteria bacterium]|nr:endonuclease domain-containing protein [Alphaproteobacteria bacterium]
MSLPMNKSLTERARWLRKNSTLSEILFWNEVKNKKLDGLDFYRQKVIGNYIVDFFCARLNVVIEIDGSTHNNKYEYDARRDNYLRSLGLRVLHIYDKDVKQDMLGVLQIVRNFCGSVPARYDK